MNFVAIMRLFRFLLILLLIITCVHCVMRRQGAKSKKGKPDKKSKKQAKPKHQNVASNNQPNTALAEEPRDFSMRDDIIRSSVSHIFVIKILIMYSLLVDRLI